VTIDIVHPQLEAYAAAHTTALPPLLQELEQRTREEFGAQAGMLSGQVVGQLLQTLVAITGATRVLEIGMFTGLSAQMMAAALPVDGRLVTCDRDPKAIALAKEFFARSPHGARIEVREGPAQETVRSLEGPFEVIFIDADKGNYINYYEAVLPLLAPRGVIAVDNVLWYGRVLDPQEADDHAIVAFNKHVASDPRVVCALLSVRDGVMLIRPA
jgi:caffeoyl-CoA O-methyltransferase